MLRLGNVGGSGYGLLHHLYPSPRRFREASSPRLRLCARSIDGWPPLLAVWSKRGRLAITHRVRAQNTYLLARNYYVLNDMVSLAALRGSRAHRRSRRANLPYMGVCRLAGTNACEGPSKRGWFARWLDLQGFAPGAGRPRHQTLTLRFGHFNNRPKLSVLILIMRSFIVLRLTRMTCTSHQPMRLARYSAFRL